MLPTTRRWDVHAGESFNDRQRQLFNRLVNRLEGKLISSTHHAISPVGLAEKDRTYCRQDR